MSSPDFLSISEFLSNEQSWICCQLGAREHYAVPRALHRQGVLELLVTDIWNQPNNLLGKLKPSLRQRFHADLAVANVYAPSLRSIAHEIRGMIATVRGWPVRFSYWQGRVTRNESFQKVAAATLSRIPAAPRRIVMAYSYMALQTFRLAKARGWRTVLGQIDAGPTEERIVARLHTEDAVRLERLDRPPPRYWSDWREECALADRIVVNSAWSQRALEAEGVPASKIRIIPIAYEGGEATEFQRDYPAEFTSSRPLRVLFLGQVILRKGVGPLLDAIRLVRGDPIEFWVVGPMQVVIPADLRNDPQVHWIGAVSRGDTAKFYREADVFIFPTFSDGFGLTQLEAQAWKLPIVATKFCGEVVKDGRNGWLLSEVTPGAIAAILRCCLANPARLQDFSSRSVSSDCFGLAQIGDQWLHVFD